ncbi:virulence factor TspB C-terminal domain-related protein [Sterolibacterium denitrificans]|uniref:virulence factor TspB C-terminal domain-related protein n=1 Tax=Sterolibacterium denitrificans TaxID=157592 RepID=UPI0012B6A676|nr:virulence factor TspB C-terminal domain-related protein [Sterolibacterium denitrificans]
MKFFLLLFLALVMPAAHAAALALVPQALPENIKVRAPLSAAPKFAPVGKLLIGNGSVAGSAVAANQTMASIGNSSFPVSIARGATPSALAVLGRNILRLSGYGALAMLGLDLIQELLQGDDDQIWIDPPQSLAGLPHINSVLPGGLPGSVKTQSCGWDQNYQATVDCANAYLPIRKPFAYSQGSDVVVGKVFYIYKLYYCETGLYFDGSQCVPGAPVSGRPPTDEELETLIAQHLIDEDRGGDFLEKAIQHNPDLWPDLGPVSVSGPASVPGETTVTTAVGPEGTTVTETQTDYDLGYAGDTMTVQQRLKTTITAPNGAVTESTAVSSGSAEATAPVSEKSTFCRDFPNASACAELGQSENSAELGNEERDFDFDQELSESGSCPSALQLNILGNSYHLEWTPLCDLASGVRPVVIAISWLSAGVFLFGIGRSAA